MGPDHLWRGYIRCLTCGDDLFTKHVVLSIISTQCMVKGTYYEINSLLLLFIPFFFFYHFRYLIKFKYRKILTRNNHNKSSVSFAGRHQSSLANLKDHLWFVSKHLILQIELDPSNLNYNNNYLYICKYILFHSQGKSL